MSEYLSLDQLINALAAKRAEYGNIPVLVSADGTDDEFLRPIGDIFAININDKKIGDSQICVVITNYTVDEPSENETPIKDYKGD